MAARTTLTNIRIADSYGQLLHIADDGGLTSTLTAVYDGDGTATPLKISTTDVSVIDGAYDFDIASHDGTNGLKLGGTIVTSSAAELNYLDISTLGTSQASKAVTVDANGDLLIPDSDKFKFGAGSDMQLYHDGSNSYVTNSTGALKLGTESSGIAISIGHGTSETTVNDNLTVSGDLAVTGTSTFNGVITLGDSVADTVAFGGTITGNLVFEGSTSDAHELTLSPGDPSGDVTVTLPVSTDTLVGKATTDTLTNKTLTSPDINAGTVDGITSLTVGTDGSGADVYFYSSTSGDHLFWDASDEKLTITGTNGQTALDVADGNVTVSDTLTATNIGAFTLSGKLTAGSTEIEGSAFDIDGGDISAATISGGLTWSAAQDLNNQNLTNVDIDSGAIDGTTIGGSSAGAGTFTTLTATSLNVSDGNITNIGDLNVDSVSSDDGSGFDLLLDDNSSTALEIKESSNAYITFVTSNSAEKIQVDKSLDINATSDFGSNAMTNVNVDSGAIDGTTIGANSAAAGTFAALVGTSLSVSDGNITNVGDINADSLSVDAAATGLSIDFGGNTTTNKITLTDNLADALNITESSNSYLKFVTSNSGEKITLGKKLEAGSIEIEGSAFDIDGGDISAATISGSLTWSAAQDLNNQNLTNVDIDSGAIDGTVIGASSVAAGTFAALVGTSLSVSDGAITNVSDIALDSISADGTDINVAVSDNSATALTIKQGSDAYLIVDTANSSESVSIGTGISGTAITLGHGTSETTVADNLTVTGNATVSGNLLVVGDSSEIKADNLVVDNPTIALGLTDGSAPSSDSGFDLGLKPHWHTGSGAKTAFLGVDVSTSASAPKLTYIPDASFSSEVVSGTAGTIVANLEGDVTGDLTGDVTGNADTATLATSFTASANNSTDETTYPIFVDGATGSQGAETDTALTYNPSSGLLTTTSVAATLTTAAQTNITSLGTLTALIVDNVSINGTTIGHTSDTDLMTLADGVLTVAGELDATTLDISGNADIDGTLEADAYTVDGTALNEYIADTVGAMVGSNTESGITVAYQDGDNTLDFTVGTLNQDTTGTAAIATTVTITDNESTDEDNAVVFTAGGDVDGGNLGLESDGNLIYNPSTGRITATQLGGTLVTAAQTNVTSLGTLTALTVDDVAVNGKVITMTGSSSDTAVFTAGTNGTLSIVTTDANAAAANIQITADGTVDIDSAGILTLDSGAAINIEPASGSAILLDGTISIDAGVVTGATSITSTAFVGDITGDVTGTADTATVATTVTITDNESTDEDNAVVFTAGGDVDGGNIGLESDGNLTYNPSTGRLTATQLAGTLQTASQTNITSVGTIGTGTWAATDVAVAHGGTGASSLTANGVLIGNGTSAVSAVDLSTKGHILIGDGSGNPSALSVGTNDYVLTADSSEATGTKWAASTAATALDGLSDAVSGISNFTNSLILGHQTTGTLSSAEQNTAVGYAAMDAITQGDDNTIMGYNAGGAITTGSDNTLIGSGAGDALTTMTDNVAVGLNALGGSSAVDSTVVIGSGAGVAAMTAAADGTVLIGKGAGAAITTGQQNTAVGFEALATNIDGDNNTAFGYQALKDMEADTDAHGYNTAVGWIAMTNLTSGTSNTALGAHAMGSGTVTGNDNVAVGTKSLYDLTSGANNIAVGVDAAENLTTGDDNIAIGKATLDVATGTSDIIAIGTDAGGAINSADADGTVVIGHHAGDAITDGQYNVCVGFEAGTGITSGNQNIAIGYQALTAAAATGMVGIGYRALQDKTTGDDVVAIGREAGKDLTTGHSNIAIGGVAMATHTTGDRNIAIGANCMADTDGDANSIDSNDCIFIGSGAGTSQWEGTCDRNIGIGTDALGGASDHFDGAINNVAVGYQSGGEVTTGDGNTLYGYQAGDAITTGSYDICIGYSAGVGEQHATQSCISIRKNQTAAGGRVRIGADSTYAECHYADEAAWNHSSDERIKRNIQDVNLGLDFINDLRTVKYQWKPSEDIPEELGYWNYKKDANGEDTIEKEYHEMNTDSVMHGMIAQEIKAALDKAGVDGENFAGWGENEKGVQTISESMFVFPLIKAIQELSAKVEALEAK